MLPSEVFRAPEMSAISVDFPAPFAPTSAIRLAEGNSNETRLSAVFFP